MSRDVEVRAVLWVGLLLVAWPLALRAEFQINSFTSLHQTVPRVSHDSAGGFVVVWESFDQDGSDYGVFGQRFDSGGTAQGGEFQINSFTSGSQLVPAVSHDSAGGFVVVWRSTGQDGSSFGVFGQRFDSGGTALGVEFQINSFTTGVQDNPAVSHDTSGGFVVVWHSNGQDGSNYGVFGQRFDSGGLALGAEFQINSFTTSNQLSPAVSEGSSFVVVWESDTQDGSSFGIFGEIFRPPGVFTGAGVGGASRARRLSRVDYGSYVRDPGFEAGTPNPDWTERSTNFGTPLCDMATCGSAFQRSGDWWVWFGGTPLFEEARVSQGVKLRSDAPATLKFFLRMAACNADPDDSLEVVANGVQVFQILGNDASCGGMSYVEQSVSLAAFPGQTVLLEFHATIQAHASPTNIYVDDTSITY